MKVAFEGIGEIDFIVIGHMTEDNAVTRDILGRTVLLETIPEIVAKKIRFRGSRIQPRDVFDIAAAAEAGFRAEIEVAPADIPDDVAVTSERLSEMSPQYVETVISQLMIRPGYRGLMPRALSITQDLLAGR